MSLLKLLSAGKSLVGVKDTASPYRMRTANRLPKFGSSKNPFESLPKTEPVQVAPKPAVMETKPLFEPKSAPVPAPVRTESVLKDFKKPAATQKMKFEPKPEAPAPMAKPEKGGSLGGWIKKLNPLAHLPKREPGARAMRPKAGRTSVQGELSLEKVRVIRNELNDSDLEFIAPKPVVKPGVAGTILPEMPKPRLTTWGRLTSRVTGVAEAQIQ